MEDNTPYNYTSSEIIDEVLRAIGVNRKEISTYQDYVLPDGKYLRLRISDHGVNLSTWYNKNKEQREENSMLPKLNSSTNIAITFALTEKECKARGIKFPQKAINKTVVKTNSGNNVKPQFSVGHIQYASWLLDISSIQQIAAAILEFTKSGVFTDPLGSESGKTIVWEDTSNLPPKKLSKSTKTIKLKEFNMREIIQEATTFES